MPGTGAAPYPWGGLSLTWRPSTYRFSGVGGDIWTVTWGADGQLHTAWGDGNVGCGRYVSYGTAILGSPAGGLRTIGCGTAGSRQGKIASLLSVRRTLYAITNLQDEPWPRNAFAVWSSTNGGRTWSRPEWTFDGRDLRPMEFVQFGPGNTGAPDGHAYIDGDPPQQRQPQGGLPDEDGESSEGVSAHGAPSAVVRQIERHATNARLWCVFSTKSC